MFLTKFRVLLALFRSDEERFGFQYLNKYYLGRDSWAAGSLLSGAQLGPLLYSGMLFLACTAGFCLGSSRGWRSWTHQLEKGFVPFSVGRGHIEDHSDQGSVVVGRMDWSSFAAEGQWSVSGFLGRHLAVFHRLYLTYGNWNSYFASNKQKPSQKSCVQEYQPSTVASCDAVREKTIAPVWRGHALCQEQESEQIAAPRRTFQQPGRSLPAVSRALPDLHPCPLSALGLSCPLPL